MDTFAIQYSNGRSDSAGSLDEARQKVYDAKKIDQAGALSPLASIGFQTAKTSAALNWSRYTTRP
ncbi:MAG: hypothetical protein ACJ72Y_07220 [Actinomycetes bacterium]